MDAEMQCDNVETGKRSNTKSPDLSPAIKLQRGNRPDTIDSTHCDESMISSRGESITLPKSHDGVNDGEAEVNDFEEEGYNIIRKHRARTEGQTAEVEPIIHRSSWLNKREFAWKDSGGVATQNIKHQSAPHVPEELHAFCLTSVG